MLPTTDWIPGFSACSGRHAWHSCRAGCIVISENPQGLATHMVRTIGIVSSRILYMALYGRLFSLACPSQFYVQIFESWLGRVSEIPLVPNVFPENALAIFFYLRIALKSPGSRMLGLVALLQVLRVATLLLCLEHLRPARRHVGRVARR